MLSRSDPHAVASACDDMALEFIMEASSAAASYADSATLAAWRGDRLLLERHLRELRAATVAAIGGYKQLSTRVGNDGGAPHDGSA